MTARKVKVQATMWAELSPDVYAGKNFDKVAHHWKTSAIDDKGDSHDVRILRLDSKHFPPGTKIVISEPICPLCGDSRVGTTTANFAAKCDCGFDWSEWVQNEYS